MRPSRAIVFFCGHSWRRCYDPRMRRASLLIGFALLGCSQTTATADIRLGSPPDFEFVARGNPPFSSATGNDADWLLGDNRDYMVSYSWFARLPSDGINRPLGSLATPAINANPTLATLGYDILSGMGASADRFQVTQHIQSQLGSVFEFISVRNDSASSRQFDLFWFVNVDVGADGTATDDTLFALSPGFASIGGSLSVFFSLQPDLNARIQADDASALLSRFSLTGSDLSFGAPPNLTGNIGVAFQWKMTLAAGETGTASAFTNFVFPEPASGAIIAVALGIYSSSRERSRTTSSPTDPDKTQSSWKAPHAAKPPAASRESAWPA